MHARRATCPCGRLPRSGSSPYLRSGPRAVARAAHRARRGEAAGGPGCAGVRVFHVVISPAGPDQAGGHEPRPSATIRQRSRLAAVVGLMVGPTTHLQLWRSAVAPPTAQPRTGFAQSGCATGRGSCAVELCRTAAQSARAFMIFSCAGSGGPLRRCLAGPGRLPSAHRNLGLGGRAARDRTVVAAPGNARRTRWPVDSRRLTHGRACGRPDHDPDHGLRVPIVTMVGGWVGGAGFPQGRQHPF